MQKVSNIPLLTPGVHNYYTGVAPSECADNDGHNTDAIDALTLTVPVIIKYADASREERNKKVSNVLAPN